MTEFPEYFPLGDIIVVDTEYSTPPGEPPLPICAVAKNLSQDTEVQVWLWDRKVSAPPFSQDALFVCYASQAELKIQKVMGWDLPENVLDLYAEYRVLTNGHPRKPVYSGLIDACAFYGIPATASEHKNLMRGRCIEGGPFSADDKASILAYCSEDVAMTSQLFLAMQGEIDWPRALVRGMYGKAVAEIELRGIPVDLREYTRIWNNWERLKAEVLLEIGQQFPVFDEDGIFKDTLFLKVLKEGNYDWPLTPTGRPSRSKDTFEEMVKVYPETRDLMDGLAMLGKMRLGKIDVGKDGRNRASLHTFATITGRCAPRTDLIWGHSVWYRNLISPKEGMAISYLDYKAQDFASAAFLSNDPAMIEAYRADPYLSFAVAAGLAPVGATKVTHKTVRDSCKTVVLGLGYGMGERTLAKRLGVPREEAHRLVKTYQEMFPKYVEWSTESIQQALLSGSQQTSYGWHHYCGGGRTSLRTIKNWPIQSTGSDILRLACILLEQEGIQVISTVHDAVVVEDTIDRIDLTVERAKEQMVLASSYALLGKGRIEVDAHTVKYPDHYSDARGDRMWERIQRILGKLEVV